MNPDSKHTFSEGEATFPPEGAPEGSKEAKGSHLNEKGLDERGLQAEGFSPGQASQPDEQLRDEVHAKPVLDYRQPEIASQPLDETEPLDAGRWPLDPGVSSEAPTHIPRKDNPSGANPSGDIPKHGDDPMMDPDLEDPSEWDEPITDPSAPDDDLDRTQVDPVVGSPSAPVMDPSAPADGTQQDPDDPLDAPTPRDMADGGALGQGLPGGGLPGGEHRTGGPAIGTLENPVDPHAGVFTGGGGSPVGLTSSGVGAFDHPGHPRWAEDSDFAMAYEHFSVLDRQYSEAEAYAESHESEEDRKARQKKIADLREQFDALRASGPDAWGEMRNSITASLAELGEARTPGAGSTPRNGEKV